MKGPKHTPHTAVHKNKRVLVILTTGEKFIGKFLNRTSKYVWFTPQGKIKRSSIKSFSIVKGNVELNGKEDNTTNSG